MKILSEMRAISDRILVENRSSEISDRILPISDSIRHGFFLSIGNRQFLMGKYDSVKNGLSTQNSTSWSTRERSG